ncbi:hypothetical protein [Streptomyces sp. NBC_00859]|uniref:hypothetical protein n=1 Tax=Streptomyces sp. NBC_00859 TaxID=2903682 RepID=UPI00386FC8B4
MGRGRRTAGCRVRLPKAVLPTGILSVLVLTPGAWQVEASGGALRSPQYRLPSHPRGRCFPSHLNSVRRLAAVGPPLGSHPAGVPLRSSAADLGVALAATGVPRLLNGHINYTVTLTNNGSSALTSATVTATLPPPTAAMTSSCAAKSGHVTCSAGALAPGRRHHSRLHCPRRPAHPGTALQRHRDSQRQHPRRHQPRQGHHHPHLHRGHLAGHQRQLTPQGRCRHGHPGWSGWRHEHGRPPQGPGRRRALHTGSPACCPGARSTRRHRSAEPHLRTGSAARHLSDGRPSRERR